MYLQLWMMVVTWALTRIDEWRHRNDTRECNGVRGKGIRCD